MHKNFNFYIHLFAFTLVLFLMSCQSRQKNDNPVKVNRMAYEFISENDSLADALLVELNDFALEKFRWKNHIILFGSTSDDKMIDQKIKKLSLQVEIKKYNSPLYVFDKASQCGESVAQEPWKNYVLTANLVEDTLMQREYVDYHNTQFEKWPEVAKGFCNADFQQLLVYRNGRQLLLVISVPGDKTLDELNPKTVENNPRVVEWNSIMSNYQEGIEGTSEDEVWVFLKEIE